MNILFVITRADAIGGAQVHVQDLASALQQDNHKVLILTGARGIYNKKLEQAGLESTSCEFLKKQINPVADGKSLRYILNVIDLFKPDLIAAHSSKTGILGRLASQMTKIPCVFTAHGWSFTTGIPEPNRTIFRWLEKSTAFMANKIICVSEYDRQIGIKAKMAPSQLVTVHNGMQDIPLNLMANSTSTKTVKIVMVARFDRQKDHATLLRAFSQLKHLDAELLLVGDGPSLANSRQQAENLEISHKIQFLGFRSNIAEILAEAHIFALISHWEGLPCTIIEAMRAGLPVIASDVGGVKEIVLDQHTGYIVPRQDTELLRTRLEYLIDNEQARISMGILGRQNYETKLTFQHMYQKTLGIYHQTIASTTKALI